MTRRGFIQAFGAAIAACALPGMSIAEPKPVSDIGQFPEALKGAELVPENIHSLDTGLLVVITPMQLEPNGALTESEPIAIKAQHIKVQKELHDVGPMDAAYSNPICTGPIRLEITTKTFVDARIIETSFSKVTIHEKGSTVTGYLHFNRLDCISRDGKEHISTLTFDEIVVMPPIRKRRRRAA